MGEWTFTPVAVIYFSAAGISFLLALIAWRLRPARGAGIFSLMMISIGIWIMAYTLDLFNTQLPWMISMMKIEYVGMAFALYLWLVFVAIYTQFDAWLNKYLLGILAIIPIYTMVNILQAPLANGLHSNYGVKVITGLTIISKTYLGGFYIWTSFAYTALGSGLILLVLRIITMPKVHRKQIYLIIPAVLVLIAANSMYVFKKNPIAPYDPTPLSLAIVGILFIISMRKHKFIEIMPVAHSHVLKNMRSAVIISDTRNVILEINPAAETILAYSQKEIAGKRLEDILPEVEQLIQNNNIENEIKSEIVLGDDKRTFELRINSLSDNNKLHTGKLLLFYDITEQKEAINELDAYARMVAHDLKNPLNSLIGLANLLNSESVDSSEKKVCVDGIINSSLRMNNIVEGLLLLAQVRNLDKLELTQLDMQAILSVAIERLSTQLKEKSGEIKISEDIANALGYDIWVEEVWVNLISNAIKYGGNKPLIEISSRIDNNFVIFSVKDYGIGLSLEDKNSVFIEFNRIAQQKTDATGHGLGLSIVYRIINKLGGKVGVESELGKGSTFSFSLPLK